MFIPLPKEKKCRESRTIQTNLVFPADSNTYGALYGGRLMYMIDDAASITASKHARRPVMTASTDKLDFLHPILEGHSVCIETYVSGTGKKSMEVFAKILGENIHTNERYLAATCFMSFVVVKHEEGFTGIPEIIPETNEEIMIHKGYAKRREYRLSELESNKELAQHISLSLPWMDDH